MANDLERREPGTISKYHTQITVTAVAGAILLSGVGVLSDGPDPPPDDDPTVLVQGQTVEGETVLFRVIPETIIPEEPEAEEQSAPAAPTDIEVTPRA